MKTFFVLFSLLVSFTANARSLQEGKECIKEKIALTGIHTLPVDMQQCSRPLKVAAEAARQGEEAESCEALNSKEDFCKVYLSCTSDGQQIRFLAEAKVRYPIPFIGTCQLSNVSATEIPANQ